MCRFFTPARVAQLILFFWLGSSAVMARAQNTNLTPAQRTWITAHREIRIAPSLDFAPIDGIDNDSRERGLSADYLKLIAARTGLNFHVVKMSSLSEANRALRERKVDLLPSSVATPERETYASFSAPYLRLSGAIYVRADAPAFSRIEQLDGHKIGIVDGSTWAELLKSAGSNAQQQSYASATAALADLHSGKIDAYIADPFTTADALTQLKFAAEIKLSAQLGMEAPLALAVRKDWPQLREILDDALKNITVEEEKSIRGRWLKSADIAAAGAGVADPALIPAHAEEIDSALQALPRQRDLSSDARKQTEDLLHQARDDETAADQLLQKSRDMTRIAATAAADAQKMEDALARDDTAILLSWRAALPERASVEQLETLLSRENSALADARAAAVALQAELSRQTSRPAQLRDELAAAHAIAEKTDNAAATEPAPAPIASALTDAQRLRELSAQRLAAIQLAALNTEDRSYEVRMRLLSAQLRERQRAASELGQHVAALENLVLDRTGAAVATLKARVQREHDEIDARSRILLDAAGANIALTDKLADTVHDLGQLRTQREDWTATLRQTTQALKNTRDRIRIGGVSEAVGLILLAEKSKLKPLPTLNRQLAELQNDYAQTRMSLIDVREQQAALADLGDAVAKAIAHLPELAADRLSAVRAGMYRLLNTRAEILNQWSLQQNRLATAQGDAEQQLRTVIATTQTLTRMLDARLLWTPSHTHVDLAWLAQLMPDAFAFFVSARWLHAAENAGSAVLRAPLTSALTLLGLIALLVLRRRTPAHLDAISAPMRRIRTDGYRLTGSALAWTLLATLPWSLALWLLAQLCLHTASTGSGFTDAVGIALHLLVLPAFVLSFLHLLTMEKGLAHSHFRWPRPRRLALHAVVPWLALLVLPAQFLINLILLRGDAGPIDTVARLLLVLSLLGVAMIGWHLFAPGKLWTSRNAVVQEPLRVRQCVRVAFCIACVLLAGLVLRGYFITALTLSERTLQSLAAVLAATTLYGLGARWLVLGERRLALKRMEQKAEESETPIADGEALHEPEPEEITLASVNAQTRRLLRAVILVAVAAALLWVWADVTPALAFLGEINLWESSQLVDGKDIALKISLRDLLEAALVLVLTWVATRNVPGLLEVGVLRRFNVDAPTRYAVTSVTRYALVVVGTLFGVSLLGLRWSNLQWLAAGFSVGLGFGMQEIFANFISGLMVLFERPIRVGDIITIGTVEGTVARIRTRATTIVDWDNKEVMVPNKSFITDRLINWTLSDSITRVVIKVGIAYRNDPKLAQELLLEIANAHPQVLREPAANCWLIGFGSSTQDFELRVHVAEIGQRNPVRSDLQMRIAEVFRERDIEIAFAQMDLWVRNTLRTQSLISETPEPNAPESISDDSTSRDADAQARPNADSTSASKRP